MTFSFEQKEIASVFQFSFGFRSISIAFETVIMPLDRKGGRYQRRSDRSTRRKFYGNQHTIETSTEFTSTSAEKFKGKKQFSVGVNPLISYCIISFFDIFIPLAQLVKCKECNGDITFTKSGERFLGFYLQVSCSCKETKLNSSPTIYNTFEINRKFVFVMRLLGIGIHGINFFYTFMDISHGVSVSAYYGILNNISVASKCVFDSVIKKAKDEEVEKNSASGHPPNDLNVSGDGTWAKRGYTSLFGVVTLIGKYTNKILDLVVKSSYCSECTYWKRKNGTPEYDMWWDVHKEECKANHEGSSGKMEVDGMVEMFRRSQALHGVRYTNYIGDGDSKTFKAVLEHQPYGVEFVINKLECVLHVGKRLYKRLMDVKKQITLLRKQEKKDTVQVLKKKKQKVEKTANFSGKTIREMSTYYSLAIQRHPDSVENMRNEIWAGFYHKISTKPQHQYCDISWCKYLQAQKDNEPYEHKPPLQDDVQAMIKPVYESLTKDDLLKRCLGRNTQNNNESYNHSLWMLASKHVFSGKTVIEIAAWVSACVFNEGNFTVLKIMELMGIKIGPYASHSAEKRDEERLKQAERVSTEQSKEARTNKKEAKSAKQEMFEEVEGLLYGSGIAD